MKLKLKKNHIKKLILVDEILLQGIALRAGEKGGGKRVGLGSVDLCSVGKGPVPSLHVKWSTRPSIPGHTRCCGLSPLRVISHLGDFGASSVQACGSTCREKGL
jgi:hypothetical protein